MLQLTAMSLRGVGSYRRGAHLEFRPLTILSGTNGSGKSTWFKNLAMMKRSTEKGMLPFAFDVNDEDATNVGFMNYSLSCSSDLAEMEGSDDESRYGPPACVGMEFLVTADFRLGTRISPGWSPTNAQQRLLYEGLYPAGTRIVILLAHPTGNVDTNVLAIPGMHHHLELRVNDASISFRRPHCPNGGNDKPEDYRPHRRAANFGSIAESEMLGLAATRIQEIMQFFFAGYFHISAVRSLPRSANIPVDQLPNDLHARRDVQPDGQRTFVVLRWNRLKPVIGEPYQGLEREVDDALQQLLGIAMEDEIIEPDTLARFLNGNLGGPQVPTQFSSGFHQLFPIIVQLGVMSPGETLSIENPEVHLHPDLQLKVSEFLIRQIERGRRIMIETHSDLIIRRVMRAMLQEERHFAQQHFSLNFAHLVQESVYETRSVLSSYGVDDRGQIIWPQGFMDESIRESQRLMDVMYVHRDTAAGEEEE